MQRRDRNAHPFDPYLIAEHLMTDETHTTPDPDPSPLAIRRRTPRWILIAIVCVLGGLVAGSIQAVERVREAAARSKCGQIGVALQNYASGHNGALPPAIVYSKDGHPLYSWRVLLLPYNEQDSLYKEFQLDEPWDSEHNIKLLDRMPRNYAAPWDRVVKVPPYHTVIHVFVGKGTPFEEGQVRLWSGPKIRLDKNDFPDGTSNTLLFVEGGDPVPWTKPEEITFDSNRPIHLQGLFKTGIRAGWADGSRAYLPSDIDQTTLRAIITRNGGEQVERP